jgi:hypothetical protein
MRPTPFRYQSYLPFKSTTIAHVHVCIINDMDPHQAKPPHPPLDYKKEGNYIQPSRALRGTTLR